MSALLNNIKVYEGSFGRNFYQIDNSNINFDINFPIDIACSLNQSQINNDFCLDCKNYGTFCGILILPCSSCINNFPQLICECVKISYLEKKNIMSLINYKLDLDNSLIFLKKNKNKYSGMMHNCDEYTCNDDNCIFKTTLKNNIDFGKFGMKCLSCHNDMINDELTPDDNVVYVPNKNTTAIIKKTK